MNWLCDATNTSQAVREIKRLAADSLEEFSGCNNDIYPPLWYTDNDNVSAWQPARGGKGEVGGSNHL